MRKGKGIILGLTALFLTLAALCGFFTIWRQPPNLVAQVKTDTGSEQIRIWTDSVGKHYVFLPGWVELSRVQLRTNRSGYYVLNGQPVTDGQSCAALTVDTVYPLSTEDGQTDSSLTILRSGGTAAMYIDVTSGSMDYIHETKGNEEPGTYRLYTEQGELEHAGSVESLKGRGNATWYSHDKKPYSLTLGVEADLLHMGRGSNWVLLSNSGEPSNLKNKCILDFARDAGIAYTAQSDWVELYLNGEYAGLYLLCERNEIHPQRVAISPDRGFLVSMEIHSRLVKQALPHVLTEAKQPLRIHESGISQEDVAKICQSAENAILAPDGIDPVTGKHWEELIDLDSWAKKYLLEELFANSDGCAISQFFYYDGEKLYAGPPWDYDVTMMSFVPQSFIANRIRVCSDKPTPWFYTLYRNETFYHRVVQLYRDTYRPLLLKLLEGELDASGREISSASAMNRIRWNGADADVYRESAETYMRQRMVFLDSVWLRGEEYCYVHVDRGSELAGVCYAVRPGEMLPELTEPEDTWQHTYAGWYDAATGEPFNPEQPIDTDMTIAIHQTTLPVYEEPEPEEPYDPLTLMRIGPLLVLSGLLLVAVLADVGRKRRAGNH